MSTCVGVRVSLSTCLLRVCLVCVHACVRACVRASERASERACERESVRERDIYRERVTQTVLTRKSGCTPTGAAHYPVKIPDTEQ